MTILERGNELILNSETTWTKEGYDDDGHPVNKSLAFSSSEPDPLLCSSSDTRHIGQIR